MTREPCGCRHDGVKWLQMCEPCAAEFRERHERAQKEKARADILGCYSILGSNEPEVVTTEAIQP